MSHIHCTTMANLVKSLITGGTANEIAERTGLDICTVWRYLRVWHRLGVVYRAEWRHGTGKHSRYSEVWRLRVNGEIDAPKPRAMTNNERCEAYRERQRLKREIEIKLERVRGMV
jgi:predicted transcriptional regulator